MAPPQLEQVFDFPSGLTLSSLSPLWIIAVVAALAVMCLNVLTISKTPMSPPVAPQRLPLIGHLVGMIVYQGGYMKSLW